MTGLALPPIATLAVEVINQVSTASSVLAEVWRTVIGVDFTDVSFPALVANALVGLHTIDASPPVFARIDSAVINVLVAVGAGEALVARARELATTLAHAAAVRTAHPR